MSTQTSLAVLLAAAAIATPAAFAADSSESLQLQALQRQIDAMRQDYEARLKALESRLGQAEAGRAAPAAPAAPTTAVDARPAAAEPSVPGVTQVAQDAAPSSSSGGFNPAIALILSGSYANLSQDPAHYRITGFLTGSEIGPGVQGFSLGESELNISASVDPWFYGALNLSVAADNSVSIEEAFVQTTALPEGMTLRAGRTLSGIGYLNDKHAHTWDFADSPLVYQAFLDGQLKQDGLQLRVLLPTPQFVEIGGELGAAGPFPSGGSNGNRPAMATLFAHTGGDVGSDSSWRAGLSTVWARANDRASSDVDSAGNDVTSLFNGTSRIFIVDGVWKWAPNGNPQRTNLTLQGEVMWRRESGNLTFDSTGQSLADGFRSSQSGWYAQAVYQFIPSWRFGLRYDRLAIGNVDAAGNNANLYLPDFAPSRATTMLDWSPSEFSRVRLQYASDRARYGIVDKQFIVQYQMSLGAHGAHSY